MRRYDWQLGSWGFIIALALAVVWIGFNLVKEVLQFVGLLAS